MSVCTDCVLFSFCCSPFFSFFFCCVLQQLLLLPLPLLPQSHFPPKPKPTTTNSFDRRVDGTYLRQPPIKELVALSAELHDLASLVPQPSTTPEHSTTAALRMFDEWIVKGKTERE